MATRRKLTTGVTPTKKRVLKQTQSAKLRRKAYSLDTPATKLKRQQARKKYYAKKRTILLTKARNMRLSASRTKRS